MAEPIPDEAERQAPDPGEVQVLTDAAGGSEYVRRTASGDLEPVTLPEHTRG